MPEFKDDDISVVSMSWDLHKLQICDPFDSVGNFKRNSWKAQRSLR